MATKRSGQDKKSKDTNVTVALIGAGATIIAAVIGLMPILIPQSKTVAAVSTATPQPIYQRLIFKDTFDDNSHNWTLDEKMTDFNEYGYKIFGHIENGKYYRVVETNGNSTGSYASVSIPDVSELNFCLIFDARIAETSEGTSVMINARDNSSSTGIGNFYTILLFANGDGSIESFKDDHDRKQISIFEGGIVWNDRQVHTVKISLQGKNLEIFDEQTGKQVHETILPDDGLILEEGKIMLGLGIPNPNQKTTLELDNVYVYDKCP